MRKALFRTMIYTGFLGILLTGCEKENVYNPDAYNQKYRDNWEKEFGDIDPQQMWNTAATSTINISVGYPGNYTAKLYTCNPRNKNAQAYLLGKFDIKGNATTALQFDMPSALNVVYVSLTNNDGGRILKTCTLQDGEANISFGTQATTRGVIEADGNLFVKSDPAAFTSEAYKDFNKVIPEGNTDNVNNPYFFDKLIYKSTGSFTVYPIYNYTSNTPIIGIYYNLNGTWIEQDIWTKSNIKCVFENEYGYLWSYEAYDIKSAINNVNFKHAECDGMTVNLPVGTEFIFYLKADGNCYYSDKTKNQGNRCYFNSFTNGYQIDGKEVLLLGAEDSPRDEDFDLNDIVCALSGNLPDFIEVNADDDTVMQYLVACEDLGSTDDFDFNDIVLAIEHASGSEEMYVEILAAGGTLPAKVLYNNTTVFEEIHEAFGVSTGTLVNTGRTSCPSVKSEAIHVPADFSILKDISKFNIVITNSNGKHTTTLSVPNQAGTVPQAFVIADPKWEWPSERQNIIERYPDFKLWVKDHTNNNWYDAHWGE